MIAYTTPRDTTEVFPGSRGGLSFSAPHEYERAASERDFFLVVVSGLQRGAGTSPTVRIILDPLRQLTVRPSGTVTLAGVRDCRSLTIPFELAD
jgi:hypothetical protein